MNKKPLIKIALIALAPVLFLLLFIIGDTVTRIVMGVILVVNLLLLFAVLKKEKEQKTFDQILNDTPKQEPEIDDFDGGAVKVTGVYKPDAPKKESAFKQNTATVKDPPKRSNIITLSDEEPTDISEKYFEITNEAAPGVENNKATISFFLDKTIKLIRENLLSHSAVFFWLNPATRKLNPAAYVVGVNDFRAMSIPVESDLLSQVVSYEKPVYLNGIKDEDEQNLIKYYNSKHGIRSFAAVPVFFDRKIIAVLAIDSKDPEAFGTETLFALGRYVRIITHMLSIVQTGFLEGLAEKRLKVLNAIIDQLLVSTSVDDILAVFEQRLRELIPAKVIYFLDFSGYSKTLKISRVFSTDGVPHFVEGTEVEISNTLAGIQLSNQGPLYYKNLGEEEIPRFSINEEKAEQGSFFTVPLNVNGQLLGILCLESPENNAFTSAETRFVARINSLLSYVFYNHSLQMMLRNDVLYDAETKTLNKKFFMERVDQDLYRIQQFKLPGSLALIAVDKFPEQMELFGGDISSKPLIRLSEFIKLDVNQTSVIGKLDKDVFGVFFFGKDAKTSFMWAERLKTKVAKQSASSPGASGGFTISIGIAPADNKNSFEEIFQPALLALQKAQDGNGGKVCSSI